MVRIEQIATEIMDAWIGGRQISPIAARNPGFDMTAAYDVARAIRRTREARGEKPIGRKIGFTNRTIWDEYQVFAPIWGDMYSTTLQQIEAEAQLDLSPYLEPRIEPEIAFGLSRAPERGMDEADLLRCIGWVAHGIEIVHSVFPGWRFTAADTVAAFGLHGAYRLGPRHPVEQAPARGWLAALTEAEIELYRDEALIDRGEAVNVLDGPLSALRHLNDLLFSNPGGPPLTAGEIITTGTVTRAFPIAPGETWRTEILGLPLPPLTLRFT